MGELLHLFYFNQDRMARKILSHEGGEDGLEAPRNSLELHAEASPSCCTLRDDLYIFDVDSDWSRSSSPYEMSMKKLINEEVSKRSSSRKNTPSIVARLMGVDTLPLDAKSASRPIDVKKSATEAKPRKKDKNASTLVVRSSSTHSSRQSYHSGETDADKWGCDQPTTRPMRREHPQEEELQKFKKEFEVWQAARFRAYSSKVVELGSNITGQKIDITSEPKKMYTWMSDNEESTRNLKFDDGLPERQRLTSDGQKASTPWCQQKMPPSRNNLISRDFEPSASASYYQKHQDTSSAPTRIVILRPGPDRLFDREDSWSYCSDNLEEKSGSIEEFLEEVKERLKCELQGKAVAKATDVRGSESWSGIENPFHEKPSDSKLISHHIARQVRDSVRRDIGSRLLRSESTRSYRRDVQFDGMDYPDYINRDCRRLLSERLRNVLRKETHLDYHNASNDTMGSSRFDSKIFRDSLDSRHEPVHWEIVNDEQVQTRSFRHDEDDIMLHRDLSPRNLVRSLSAPVSGTSFGKLLLEDPHILTGAHIRRKHEADEHANAVPKKRKKEKFSIKQRVSNLRNFTLKGRLFGKKLLQSVVESGSNKVKDMRSGPTVVTNLVERRMMENSTEVPPSPASVCSNSYEELWKPPSEYLSPVSTPEFFPGEDGATQQAFRDISSNLNELRRQPDSNDRGDEPVAEKETAEPEVEDHIEDMAEAYIRELLVASGLYHGSTMNNRSLSIKLDDIAKPVSKSVFQEVEEAYKRKEECGAADDGHLERKMLFDLVNEVLPSVCKAAYGVRRKLVDVSMMMAQAAVGRRLLEGVWKMMCEYLYPGDGRWSLESMVAGKLECGHWMEEEEGSGVGREVECLITGELIEELVRELHCMHHA